MVLEIRAFGVGQHYSGTFAIGMPMGFTSVKCALIDGASNMVIGQQYAVNAEIPQGKCYEPSEFSTVIQAINIAFEKSLDECFIRMFGRVP